MENSNKKSLLGEVIWIDGCHYVLEEPNEEEWAEHKKHVRRIKEQKEKDFEKYRQREKPFMNKFIWINGKHYIMHRPTPDMVKRHHEEMGKDDGSGKDNG